MPRTPRTKKLEASLERLVEERVRAERWGVVYDLRDLLRGLTDRLAIIEGRLEAQQAAIVSTNNYNLSGQQVIVSQLNGILRKAGLDEYVQDMQLGSDSDEPTAD